MKPISQRTDFDQYTSIERCQETNRPIKVYNLEVEKKTIWNSMTQTERLKLHRVNQLVDLQVYKMTSEEKKEYLELSDWMEENDISLFDMPASVRGV